MRTTTKNHNFQNAAAALLVAIFALVNTAVANAQAPDILWQAQAGKAVAFSPDSQLLLAGTKLLRAADGTLIRNFRLTYNGGGINCVAYSPDGSFVAIGIQSYNQNLNLFRVSDGRLLAGRISAHGNGTLSLAFSADGQLLASGGRDGTAKLWHLPDMTLVHTLNGGPGYPARVFAVAFSGDDQTLAVAGLGGVHLFRVSDGAQLQSPRGATRSLSLAVSPDGQTFAAGSNNTDQYGNCIDCSIKLWRFSDGAPVDTIEGNSSSVIAVTFSRDHQFIVSGSADPTYNGVVKFWRVSDGALVQAFNQDPNNYSAYVTSVAYSPDGSLFAFARQDGLVVVTRNR
jgi:WD40 repeat protein